MSKKSFNDLDEETFERKVQENRIKRMEEIDRLSPEIRKLVHEYGYNVVKNFMACKITKPKQIKHLVETVLCEFSPTRGSFAKQGKRTDVNHS